MWLLVLLVVLLMVLLVVLPLLWCCPSYGVALLMVLPFSVNTLQISDNIGMLKFAHNAYFSGNFTIIFLVFDGNC